MLSISIVANEYLYKMKYYFRRAIPSNPFFYIIIFLIKYFPLILFTHCNEANTIGLPPLFTLSKIIKSIIIFNQPKFSYITVCSIIYIIMILISLIWTFTAYRMHKASKKQIFICMIFHRIH